jgi:hypothetical protein
MPKLKKDPSFICIRETFTFNKHFMPGDGFPEEWIKAGYKPSRHFAPAKEAQEALEQAENERMMYGHGDDKRSTKELKETLSVFMKQIPKDWPRKKIWLELRRLEAAESRDKPKPKG